MQKIDIPTVIKTARVSRGLTQKQLGLLCGYEQKSAERVVQHWEHGDQPVPNTRIRALATALHLTLDQLIP